jgi:hypothetical protein
LHQPAAAAQQNATGECGGRPLPGQADRWQARINIHGRKVFLGAFKSKEEAMAAYRGARASAEVINRIVIEATGRK